MLATGDRLGGRFTIESLLGRGGCADVYRAVDETTSRPVALKVHTLGAGGRGGDWSWRVRREFYQLAHLAHPNIVKVHEFGEDEQRVFYSMDLIPGLDAHEILPLAEREV